ncbi:prolyl 4-hydroxylase subunit alpha-1 isoform X1 [Octopus bimaculoides]|nr:prolyl 4-hydroxylase subunit alpha-1 isoform X1 [Octopus bimaculoides]
MKFHHEDQQCSSIKMDMMQLLKVATVITAALLVWSCDNVSANYLKRTSNTALSSYINLEQQFSLESEIISLMQTLQKEEMRAKKETELDLNEIEIQVNQSKTIHRAVGTDLEEYLNHPFNAFHLIKRLYYQWLKIFNKILVKKIQHKGLRLKLDNLVESFPDEEDFITISWGLARMQYLKNIDLTLLMNGTVFNKHSLQKPTVTDLFQISRMIFEEGNFYTASQWLRETLKICKKSGKKKKGSDELLDNQTLNITNILSLLASSLYEMEQYGEGVKVLQELLDVDPHNKRAKENKKFFEKKLKSPKKAPGKMEPKLPEDFQEANYEKLCLKQVVQPVEKTSRLYCYLHPTHKQLLFGKAEILSLKPRIIIFHDLVKNNITDSIKGLGINEMHSMLEHNIYKYEMQGISLDAKMKSQKQNELKRHFTNLKNLVFPPLESSVMEIRNFGLQGFFAPLHAPVPSTGGQIGSFLVALNDVLEGAEIVFPFANITTTVKKGSALFWYAIHLYPAVCPLSHGSLWLASIGYYEGKADYCRMTERRAWDLRWRPQKKQKPQVTMNNTVNENKKV